MVSSSVVNPNGGDPEFANGCLFVAGDVNRFGTRDNVNQMPAGKMTGSGLPFHDIPPGEILNARFSSTAFPPRSRERAHGAVCGVVHSRGDRSKSHYKTASPAQQPALRWACPNGRPT